MKAVVCHRDTKEQKRESAVIGFGIRKGTERKPCDMYARTDRRTDGQKIIPCIAPLGPLLKKGPSIL